MFCPNCYTNFTHPQKCDYTWVPGTTYVWCSRHHHAVSLPTLVNVFQGLAIILPSNFFFLPNPPPPPIALKITFRVNQGAKKFLELVSVTVDGYQAVELSGLNSWGLKILTSAKNTDGTKSPQIVWFLKILLKIFFGWCKHMSHLNISRNIVF